MRILQISKYYDPFKGGIESVTKSLSEGLARKGLDVTVLCASTKNKFEINIMNDVKVIRMPILGVAFSQPLHFSILTDYRYLFESSDIIHVHTPNPISELATLLQSKQTPYFITHHSDIVRQKSLGFLYRAIQKKFYKNSSGIIVPTKKHIESSNILGSFSHKCEIIPFGISKRGDLDLRKIEHIKQEFGQFALFVGRLVKYKGLDILIKACQKAKQNLIIIGDGPEKKNLKLLATKLGLDSRVKFLEQVPSDSLHAFYNCCDFFILPSVNKCENLGIVQLEALSHGKAIVASNIDSGMSTIVQDNINGYLAIPGDIDDLAMKINLLYNDPQKREEFGRHSLKIFAQGHALETMIARHIEIYENELYGPSKPLLQKVA